MNEYKSHITENGRILLPAKCRKEMNLVGGDEVVIKVEDGVAKIFSLKMAVKQAQDKVNKYIKGKRSLSNELIKMRRKEAKNE